MPALKSFTGEEPPAKVKIKGMSTYILVDFAELKIPTRFVKCDLQRFAKEFDVKVEKHHDFVKITPNFVVEKMREEHMISTFDGELRTKLEDWFKKNAKRMVAELLGFGGG